MCLKSILFLEERSQQVSVDGKISAQEIYQLQIELDRFIGKVVKSDLPASFKKKTKQLTIAYKARPESKQTVMFSCWDFGKNRREGKMKEVVRGFLAQIVEFKKYLNEKATLD